VGITQAVIKSFVILEGLKPQQSSLEGERMLMITLRQMVQEELQENRLLDGKVQRGESPA